MHSGMLYEAKVNAVRYDKADKEWQYYVHYIGWKTKWDEWVSERLVLAYNEENLIKQKELKQRKGSLGATPTPGSVSKKSTTPAAAGGLATAAWRASGGGASGGGKKGQGTSQGTGRGPRGSGVSDEPVAPRIEQEEHAEPSKPVPASTQKRASASTKSGKQKEKGGKASAAIRTARRRNRVDDDRGNSSSDWGQNPDMPSSSSPTSSKRRRKDKQSKKIPIAARQPADDMSWNFGFMHSDRFDARRPMEPDVVAVEADDGGQSNGSRSSVTPAAGPAIENKFNNLKRKRAPETVSKVPESDSEIEWIEDESTDDETIDEFDNLQADLDIVLPEKIKTFLVDDRHHVVDQRRLVKLPARHTVETILSSFLSTRRNNIVTFEFIAGLQDYFNTVLGSQLLYRSEREQYMEVHRAHEVDDNDKVSKKPFASVYGAPHLFRLFVVLGQFFPVKGLDSNASDVVKACANELFAYILDQGDKYLSFDDYGYLVNEYQKQEKDRNEAVDGDAVVGSTQAKDTRKRI